MPETIDLQRFEEQGFLVVKDLLDPENDLQPVMDEYAALLDAIATRWSAEGRLTSTYADLPFGERLTSIYGESQIDYNKYFDIALPLKNLTEDTPIHLGKAVFNLLRNPRLLDAVEAVIGPEIYCNPVHHVRIKIPERLVLAAQRNSQNATTDCHQDQGVLLEEADASDILTVWVPITDATEENGCLKVTVGSHRSGLQPHCPPNDKRTITHIPDQFLVPERTIPLPMRRGSVLFMHRLTMHASLPNQSDSIRWSFDLRYNPLGQPTGRPQFPGFVARSRSHPESVLTDHRVWAAMWLETRRRVAQAEVTRFDRWSSDSSVCA